MLLAESSPSTNSFIGSVSVSLPKVDSAAPEWVLSALEADNEELRRDFFYDHVSAVLLWVVVEGVN